MKSIIMPLLCVLLAACGTREARYTPPTDADIAASVRVQLASEGRFSSLGGIQVAANAGVVTLTGMVESKEASARAESVARSTTEVQGVVNDLQVIRPGTVEAPQTPTSSDFSSVSAAAAADVRNSLR